MMNDLLRLKSDVLNELRNMKYYLQDDLRVVTENTSASQREKIQQVIKIVEKINNVDLGINTVESIFQITPPQEQQPTNIVELPINQHGHTHTE